MLKKMILGTAICFGLVFFMEQNCIAQEKTKDELKAERDVLKNEMKSKDALERKAKLEKLEAPKPSGIQSVDDLASNSTLMLDSLKKLNILVPEMYNRTIGETVDGVTSVTTKKPTLIELLALANNIKGLVTSVSNASKNVTNASNDISKASPLKAPKATKALGYTKDVISLLAPELQMNAKVISNLISTLKSSNNN